MTVPSTEELQRLLDETPDETWRAEIDEGEGWWNVVPAYCGGSHTPIAEGMSQPVAELMAESRVLAAEVIRLREAIETIAEISETRADNCHASHQLVAAVGHRETSRRLTRILEGDQA